MKSKGEIEKMLIDIEANAILKEPMVLFSTDDEGRQLLGFYRALTWVLEE